MQDFLMRGSKIMRPNELIGYLDLIGGHDLLRVGLERLQRDFEEEVEGMKYEHEDTLIETKNEIADSIDNLEEELIKSIRTCSYESIEEVITLLFTNFHTDQKLRQEK